MSDEIRSRSVKAAIWRPSGFMINQERDRESDDTTDLTDLFTFSDLNPAVQFSTRLTRRERLQVGLFFIKRAVLGNR